MKTTITRTKKICIKIGEYQTWTAEVGMTKEFDEKESISLNEYAEYQQMNDDLNAEIKKEIETAKALRGKI